MGSDGPALEGGEVTATHVRPTRAQERSRFSRLWADLVMGHARIDRQWATPTALHLSAQLGRGPLPRSAALSPIERTVLTRTLCGDQQKLVASDLGLAHSTVSQHRGRALDKVLPRDRRLSIPLVLAAQAFHLGLEAPGWSLSLLEENGARYLLASVPAPRVHDKTILTVAECAVMLHLIEGRSVEQIAAYRSTSASTVNAQLHAISSKLGFRGRFGAIRRAAELGWFGLVPMGPT